MKNKTFAPDTFESIVTNLIVSLLPRLPHTFETITGAITTHNRGDFKKAHKIVSDFGGTDNLWRRFLTPEEAIKVRLKK